MDKMYVLLYSKYSSNSKRIIDQLENSTIDLSKSIGLQLLCVDNEQLRNRILKSKQIKILSVPCLLILLPDGTVEKYEGQTMFTWFDEIIISLQPKIPNTSMQTNNINIYTNDNKKENKIINEGQIIQNTSDTNPEINDVESDNELEYIKELPPKQKKKKQPNKNKKQSVVVTNIDDINSDSDSNSDSNEDESQHETPIKNKKQKVKRAYMNDMSENNDGSIKPRSIPIRTNAGNYEFSEVAEYEQPETHVTQSSESSKKGGLMAAALAMQKSREKEDTNNKRPFPGSM